MLDFGMWLPHTRLDPKPRKPEAKPRRRKHEGAVVPIPIPGLAGFRKPGLPVLRFRD